MSALPGYIDPELWAAFLESRRAMRVPFTPRAELLVIRKLMGFHAEGWCPNASLEKSAIYGYRGVFKVEKIATLPTEKDPWITAKEAHDKRAIPCPPELRARIKELKA